MTLTREVPIRATPEMLAELHGICTAFSDRKPGDVFDMQELWGCLLAACPVTDAALSALDGGENAMTSRTVPVEPTDEMVDAYLDANAAYWVSQDQLPTPIGKWRSGTAKEATKAGYRAMLSAAPVADQPAASAPEQLGTYSAWLIERNSMWGCEWFCARNYDNRWTKDAYKAIHFPSKSAAEEVWGWLFKARGEPLKPFPYTQDGAGDWEYKYEVTEHMFNCGIGPEPSAPEREAVAEVISGNETICYPHIKRLVDIGKLPVGSKLYTHPPRALSEGRIKEVACNWEARWRTSQERNLTETFIEAIRQALREQEKGK